MAGWTDGPIPLAAPRIVMGADGLPHCAACLRDPEAVCRYHAKQIATALGQLKTSSRTNEMAPTAPINKRVVIHGERET